MIVLYIFLSFFLFLIFILCVPVRVRLESRLVFYVYWLFIKIRVRSVDGNVKTELKLFNKKTNWFKSKAKADKKAEKTEKKQSKKTKKKKKKKRVPRKISKDLIFEILGDAAIKKALRVVTFFFLRCLKSVRINLLKWNIGIDDYYWQGIITGLLSSVPQTKQLQLSGNFQEENDFVLVVKISILRLISAVMILLIRFPYFKAYRLYRRIYIPNG